MRPCAALALVLVACVPDVPLLPTSVSSTIVRDPTTGHLWVTSPDDDALVEIDPSSGEQLLRMEVVGSPQEMALAGTAFVVTLGRAAMVAVIDPNVSDSRIPVGCGWTRSVAVQPGTHRAFVTCPDDDRVIEIDVAAATVTRTIEVIGEPTAVAVVGEALYVTLARRGAYATFDLSGDLSTPRITPLPVDPGRAASQPVAIAAAPGRPIAIVYQSVANGGPRDLPVTSGGYGSLVDGSPRIEPRVFGTCIDRYAVYDGGALAMSGPSAIAIDASLVWIANMYTDDVLVIDCSEGPGHVLATFRVGRAPRGITLSEGGRTAFVDLGFDWAVTSLHAPTTPTSTPIAPTWTRTRSIVTTQLSSAALRGRSLFFDATNTHLTPSGVVTCGTCHPRGGEDGLSWFLHTPNVGPKLRRTLPAWGARPALAPLHWDGQFADTQTLAQTTTHELMNGDGLLVSFDDVAAYLSELAPPPPRPIEDAAAVTRGQALFASAGCTSCHPAPMFADRAFHSVIPTPTDSAAALASVDTPSLIAIRARSPFFHDGSALTLRDTITILESTHTTATLTPSEIDDLVIYLESL